MTGFCYYSNNKLVLLYYLSIFSLDVITFIGKCPYLVLLFFLNRSVILDCQGLLSCVPMVYFINFFLVFVCENLCFFIPVFIDQAI